DGQRRGRDPPLPRPLAARAGILAGQRPWQLDPARPSLEIARVLALDVCQMRGERGDHHGRERYRAIFVALARANRDLVAGEVDVLHAEPRSFEQPQPASIE